MEAGGWGEGRPSCAEARTALATGRSGVMTQSACARGVARPDGGHWADPRCGRWASVLRLLDGECPAMGPRRSRGANCGPIQKGRGPDRDEGRPAPGAARAGLMARCGGRAAGLRSLTLLCPFPALLGPPGLSRTLPGLCTPWSLGSGGSGGVCPGRTPVTPCSPCGNYVEQSQ